MTIKDYFRNGVNRMAEGLELFKKDVFELDGVPAFRQFYQLYIFVWQAIYKGFYKEWHMVPIVTPNDPKGKKRTMSTMNAGKLACTQMARYVWNERCSINVSQKDYKGDDPDPLNEFLQCVLRDNSFGTAFGDLVEKVFALGGGALKEWVEIPKDENGNDVGEGRIRISYHMASQFVPTAWENNRVREGLFVSREAKDGFYYSTVEWHRWNGDTYRVTNEVYRKEIKDGEPQNILGWWYPLDRIYPLLSPATEIKGLGNTMFQYIRPFGANYADDNSPLGMSIFAPALNTLHSLDIIFDSLQREFTLGKKRIIVPARALRKVPAINGSGIPQSFFDANDEVYQALAFDDVEGLKIHDNSVDLRVTPHIDGINGELSILCAQLGFDPGTLAFDKSAGLKTATEVISENSKTYGTVKAHENGLQDALENMVHSIMELATVYDVKWQGRPVSELLKNGYSVSVKFDDSIIQDRSADIDEGLKLISAQAMSKRKFMTDTLGYTPEEADAEIQQIADEQRINGGTLDSVIFSTTE